MRKIRFTSKYLQITAVPDNKINVLILISTRLFTLQFWLTHIPTWSSCSAIFWLHYIIYYYIIALSLFNSTSCLCMWSLSFLCKTIWAYRSSKFWITWGFINLTFSSLRVERWLSIKEISWRRRSISFLYSRRLLWHFSMYPYKKT